jgi:hypothetical protein
MITRSPPARDHAGNLSLASGSFWLGRGCTREIREEENATWLHILSMLESWPRSQLPRIGSATCSR